jgi:hypothetical protein
MNSVSSPALTTVDVAIVLATAFHPSAPARGSHDSLSSSPKPAQPFGVTAQLGIVKGPRKLKDVVSHGVHPARRPALFGTA